MKSKRRLEIKKEVMKFKSISDRLNGLGWIKYLSDRLDSLGWIKNSLLRAKGAKALEKSVCSETAVNAYDLRASIKVGDGGEE